MSQSTTEGQGPSPAARPGPALRASGLLCLLDVVLPPSPLLAVLQELLQPVQEAGPWPRPYLRAAPRRSTIRAIGGARGKPTPVEVGELLLREEMITQRQHQEAVSHQQRVGGSLQRALVSLGFVRDDTKSPVCSRVATVCAASNSRTSRSILRSSR